MPKPVKCIYYAVTLFGNMVWNKIPSRHLRKWFYQMLGAEIGKDTFPWGLTVNEALEAGCPVIATDAVGSSYDLLDGKSGIQIESCNVDAVSNAIKNFEVNEDVHIYCKNKAKQYSVEKMAEGFSRIIKKVSDV